MDQQRIDDIHDDLPPNEAWEQQIREEQDERKRAFEAGRREMRDLRNTVSYASCGFCGGNCVPTGSCHTCTSCGETSGCG